MSAWHGYVVLRRPPGLTRAEWAAILAALRRIWDTRPNDPQPAKRLHWRASRDGNTILIESTFDRRDLNPGDLTRLVRYVQTQVPRIPAATLAAHLDDALTVMGGRHFEKRSVSRRAARAWLAAHREDWTDEERANDARPD